MAQQVKNMAQCSIPGLAQLVKDPELPQGGIGCRCSSDPVLPWLWYRPAAAALIQPLAQELPYVTSTAVNRLMRCNWSVVCVCGVCVGVYGMCMVYVCVWSVFVCVVCVCVHGMCVLYVHV